MNLDTINEDHGKYSCGKWGFYCTLNNGILYIISMLITLTLENLADSGLVVIPYKVINMLFDILYGIITGPLSANIS